MHSALVMFVLGLAGCLLVPAAATPATARNADGSWSVAPATLAFGSTTWSPTGRVTPPILYFTVTNNDPSKTLRVDVTKTDTSNGIMLETPATNGQYPCDVFMGPGGSCKQGVVFSPSAAGHYTATFTIAASFQGVPTPSQTVTATGDAVAAGSTTTTAKKKSGTKKAVAPKKVLPTTVVHARKALKTFQTLDTSIDRAIADKAVAVSLLLTDWGKAFADFPRVWGCPFTTLYEPLVAADLSFGSDYPEGGVEDLSLALKRLQDDKCFQRSDQLSRFTDALETLAKDAKLLGSGPPTTERAPKSARIGARKDALIAKYLPDVLGISYRTLVAEGAIVDESLKDANNAKVRGDQLDALDRAKRHKQVIEKALAAAANAGK